MVTLALGQLFRRSYLRDDYSQSQDHTGDPSTFPAATDLIVGPGFKGAFVPGYPTNETSPVLESAWEGRNLREINFDTEGAGLKIGQYVYRSNPSPWLNHDCRWGTVCPVFDMTAQARDNFGRI